MPAMDRYDQWLSIGMLFGVWGTVDQPTASHLDEESANFKLCKAWLLIMAAICVDRSASGAAWGL